MSAEFTRSEPAPFDLSTLPLLDDLQVGHLRHIHNLARQADGDWSFMGGPDSWHSGGTLFKQLGALYWPLALAHYHHLPAAPAVFRDTSLRLIDKMRRVDVWGYWRDMSASGPWYDKTLEGGSREGWVDPVIRENIMYSARLAMMAGMHAVLFDDNRYDEPGGLSLAYPYPYAGGPMTFDYTLQALNERIYWQIVESGYLGVSCEPNMTFIVCNQYAIIAQRLNDIRQGTDLTADLVRSYEAAWQEKGWLNDTGSLLIFYKPSQDLVLTRNFSTAWDAYSLTFMNCWNADMVGRLYPRNFSQVFRDGSGGALSIWPQALADQVQQAIAAGQDPARTVDQRQHQFSDSYYDLAFYLPFLAEVGDEPRLRGLLAHADQYMVPTWRDGGLYYPRNDRSWDDEGNLVYMDPWCGNGAIAHARLGVKDGLRTLYRQPWTKAHFDQPNLSDLCDAVDVLRAVFMDSRNALVLTVRGRNGTCRAELGFANIAAPGPDWTLYRGAEAVARGSAGQVIVLADVEVAWDGAILRLGLGVRDATNLVFVWSDQCP